VAHVRQQIRERIVSVLTTNVTLVSSRVFGSRVYSFSEADLPAITVYAGSETSGLQTLGLKTSQRIVSIQVDAYVRATSDFDDDVDAIAVQIEEAIANDFTVNGLAKTAVLSSTEMNFSGEAEQPIGSARLTFDVRYDTAINDVETAR
jgi:hypothetical protein|tara:strand:- start:229 stop:672 length:444 start_codon:yes stop_codon:yes gene_type:complete